MANPPRKIVHVDMDAFYASVEQRDDPKLRGRPVVVAWKGARSVVCAASYEARRFGIRSAMPALRAERLCPSAIFVPPDFTRYKAVSKQVREIFARATHTAEAIRRAIREELHLTASAGVAPNKFLAKIASDFRKPDGHYVVRPEQVDAFLAKLPAAKLPGVGKVTSQKLESMGVTTVEELRGIELPVLEARFGRWGRRLYELARGIDESPVRTERPATQLSAEDTFEQDLLLDELTPFIELLAEKVWARLLREEGRFARTVVLKLKTADFRVLTRSLTTPTGPRSLADLVAIAKELTHRVDQPKGTRYRLVGVGVAGLEDVGPFTQLELFDDR